MDVPQCLGFEWASELQVCLQLGPNQFGYDLTVYNLETEI